MNDLEKRIALEALQKTIDIVGNVSALAKKLGIKPQSVEDWIKKSKRAPAERVLELEKLVNGQVKRYQYRPDIYDRGDPINY